MDHSAGLDVSVKETSVCIVDDTGKIVREVKVADKRTQPSKGRYRTNNGQRASRRLNSSAAKDPKRT